MIILTATQGKKLQKSTSGYSVLVSKEAVKQLGLKAQDDNCKLVEYIDREGHRLIFQVIKK